MKQFNLEEYLANPSRKVVTRDGRSARIICTDAKIAYGEGEFPIAALVETRSKNGEYILSYLKDGRAVKNITSDSDLFFAPEKHEGWVNVYRGLESGKLYCANVFESEELAKGAGKGSIATIKIEWEE